MTRTSRPERTQSTGTGSWVEEDYDGPDHPLGVYGEERPEPECEDDRRTPPRSEPSIKWLDDNIDRIIAEVESDGPTTLTLREWKAYEFATEETAEEPRCIPDDHGH